MKNDPKSGAAAADMALRQLRRCLKAAERLRGGKDPEALHDLRTALRRLRVVLGAYRSCLGPAAAAPVRERLRELSRLTGPARDAQVWSAWLARHGHDCHITDSLVTHLQAVAEHSRKEFIAQSLPVLKTAARKLAERLESVKPGKRPFSLAAREAVDRAAARLGQALEAARRRCGPSELHRLRIAAKRLRYVLEPLPGSSRRVKELRALQDLLGRLHDLHQLMTCAVPPACEPARQQALRLEEAFRRDWLRSGRLARLSAGAGKAAAP